MLVKTLMIIIGSITTTLLIFVSLLWGGTFLENIDFTDIRNPIDEIADHAERTAEKMKAKMKGADDE